MHTCNFLFCICIVNEWAKFKISTKINYLSLYKNVVLAYVSFSIKFFLGKLQTKYHFFGGGWQGGGGDYLALGCIHTYIK